MQVDNATLAEKKTARAVPIMQPALTPFQRCIHFPFNRGILLTFEGQGVTHHSTVCYLYVSTHFNPQLLPTLVPTCSGPVGEAVVGPEHVRDAQEVLDRAQGAPYLKLEILKC